MHADGSLFSSNAASAIGAMNPPSLYVCSLYSESILGISSSCGHFVVQYLHPVHGTVPAPLPVVSKCAAVSRIAISSSLRGLLSLKKSIFYFSCSKLDIPERIMVTPGTDSTKPNAQLAGV